MKLCLSNEPNGMRQRLNRILEWFIIMLFMLLLFDVLLQVASRYLFENAASFTDELAGFLLMWVGLSGAAYATGKREHLAINLLQSKAGDRWRPKMEMLVDSLVLLFAICVLVIGGSWLVYTRFYLGQISASLEIPLGLVYLILPISGMIISFYSLDDICCNNSNK